MPIIYCLGLIWECLEWPGILGRLMMMGYILKISGSVFIGGVLDGGRKRLQSGQYCNRVHCLIWQ